MNGAKSGTRLVPGSGERFWVLVLFASLLGRAKTRASRAGLLLVFFAAGLVPASWILVPGSWILDPGSWLVVSIQILDQNLVQGPFLVQNRNQIICGYWFWYLVLNLRLWLPI